jgi:hypothetical protein
MSEKARRPTTPAVYHPTLNKAMKRHLPCGLFDRPHSTGKIRWGERYLVLCVILMAWGINATLAERFDSTDRRWNVR